MHLLVIHQFYLKHELYKVALICPVQSSYNPYCISSVASTGRIIYNFLDEIVHLHLPQLLYPHHQTKQDLLQDILCNIQKAKTYTLQSFIREINKVVIENNSCLKLGNKLSVQLYIMEYQPEIANVFLTTFSRTSICQKVSCTTYRQ